MDSKIQKECSDEEAGGGIGSVDELGKSNEYIRDDTQGKGFASEQCAKNTGTEKHHGIKEKHVEKAPTVLYIGDIIGRTGIGQRNNFGEDEYTEHKYKKDACPDDQAFFIDCHIAKIPFFFQLTHPFW